MTDRMRKVLRVIGQALFILSILIAFGCAFLMGRYTMATDIHAIGKGDPIPVRSAWNGWTEQQVRTFGETVLGVAYACQGRNLNEETCKRFLAHVLAGTIKPDGEDHLDD